MSGFVMIPGIYPEGPALPGGAGGAGVKRTGIVSTPLKKEDSGSSVVSSRSGSR